ncbi:MAG: DNA mismatch repair protein MutS, partial [Nitrospinae bacterium]|nr:DNA mismatch repair protein MutS [Nitrospinota bacterium]
MGGKKQPEETPLMKQYHEIKEQNKNAILFFRMGDFYEMFHEDAIVASKILGISLTSRDRNSPNPVPLCGIPYHAVDVYLTKMIKAGQRVAICEQVEDPKTAKGIVKRKVIRIVSPGTVIDQTQIISEDSNHIFTITKQGKYVGVSFVELTTGEFYGAEFHEKSKKKIIDFLGQQSFSEVVVTSSTLSYLNEILREVNKEKVCVTTVEDWYFDKNLTGKILKEHFQVLALDGFGLSEKDALIVAAGGLLNYLKDTQQSELKHIETIRVVEINSFMSLDFST